MRYLVVLFIGILSLPLHASVKVDVFSSEVVLDETKADAETRAKAEGLKQVIIRASGDKNAINSPVIKKVLNRSGNYLSQISYGEQLGQKSIKMVFNPPQIQSLLGQAELPYWSDIRSNLVVWVIQEGQYGREILWDYTDSSALNQIKIFSDLRGLPITIPVGDIEDVTSISGPDLWGSFTSPISKASVRYSSDAVLVIRVQKAANGSYVRWTLYDEKPEFIVDSKREPVVGEATGDTLKALEVVIDEVSNYYARKSAIKSSGVSENTITAKFIEVESAQSFFTLENMLQKLSSVAGVDVEKIIGNEVTFNIHLLGSEIDFETEVIQSQHVRKFEVDEFIAPTLNENSITPELNVTVDGTELVESAELVESTTAINPSEETTVKDNANTFPPAIEEAINTVEQEPMLAVNSLVFEWVK